MAINFNTNNTNPAVNNQSKTQQAGKTDGQAQKNETSNVSSDKSVHLGAGANLIKKVEVAMQNVPEVDTARVNAAKEAIADGSYAVNADTIAKKLVTFEG